MMKPSKANITLAGGMSIQVKSLTMYDEATIREAAALWHEVDKKLGASSGNIGFMGSPTFVLGAVTAASLFSKWQQEKLGKDALELMEAANHKYQEALAAGREFDWSKIEGTHLPEPGGWKADVFQDLKRKIFIPRLDGHLLVWTDEDKSLWIMWRHVVAYEPITIGAPNSDLNP